LGDGITAVRPSLIIPDALAFCLNGDRQIKIYWEVEAHAETYRELSFRQESRRYGRSLDRPIFWEFFLSLA